jgi:hypothetical protein
VIIKKNPAGRRFDQPEDESCKGGLATAGFSDNTQNFSFPDIQGDIIDRFNASDGAVQQTGGYRKMLGEILNSNEAAHADPFI